MEITDEIKAKVFLPYWGKPFINGMGNQVALSLTDIQDISSGKIKAQLLLRPLSAITDEDYVEMWRMGIEKGLHKWTDKEKINAGWAIRNILFNGAKDVYPVYNKSAIISFLIDKGYDLPHYLLGGFFGCRTLKDVGLAIYEK